MNTKCKYFILLLMIISGCNNLKVQQLENVIRESLSQIKIGNEQCLLLIITDHMCMECVSQEFLNLKELEEQGKAIIIVGVCANKRHFLATMNEMTNPSVYVDFKKYKITSIPKQPFYCLYDSSTKELSDVFYPQPCNTSATFDYLHRMIRLYKL